MASSIGYSINLTPLQVSILTQKAAGIETGQIARRSNLQVNQIDQIIGDAVTSSGLNNLSELIEKLSFESLIHRQSPWSDNVTLPPDNPYLAKGYSATMHANAASSDATINRGPGVASNYDFARTEDFGYAVPTILMDSKGALIAVGVKSAVLPKDRKPTILLLDPNDLSIIDKVELPAPLSGNVAGGIYSYIDHKDNLVTVTAEGKMQWYSNNYDIATGAGSLSLSSDPSLQTVDVGQPGVVGTVPDNEGNIWYATQSQEEYNLSFWEGLGGQIPWKRGKIYKKFTSFSPTKSGVGFYSADGSVSDFYTFEGEHETVANSISSSPTGVAVATTQALYMFERVADRPRLLWRQEYSNNGKRKPGQLSKGTGSSPTFFGSKTGYEYVSIADNADEESILVFDTQTGQELASHPFLTARKNSGTENSSIGVGASLFTPSTYGYWYPGPSQDGDSDPKKADFVGGQQMLNINDSILEESWPDNQVQSAGLPRLSVPDGLIYGITATFSDHNLMQTEVQYYLSAIDAETGKSLVDHELPLRNHYFGDNPDLIAPQHWSNNPLQMVGTMDTNKNLYQGKANGLFRVSGPNPQYGIGVTETGFKFSNQHSYDGNGYTFNSELLRASAPGLDNWNGPVLELQGKGPNYLNFTWANGQTIAIDESGANTLTIFGSSVNGTKKFVDITVNFTDGTSEVWKQSFSDWGSYQSYAGESIYSTQNQRNFSDGTTQEFNNHVYAYQYNGGLDENGNTKEIASITLPFEYDLRILDIQGSQTQAVDLVSKNTFAITTPPWQVANHQGFDGSGNYYSSFMFLGDYESSTAKTNDLVEDYLPLSWNGVSFNIGQFPTSNSQVGGKRGLNNVLKPNSDSRRVDMPDGDFDKLYLAGAGSRGSQVDQVIEFYYVDGTSDTRTQTFSDWRNGGKSTPPSGVENESVIVAGHIVNQMGNKTDKDCWVYGYSFDLGGKELDYIILPDNDNIGILGATLA